MNKTLLLITTIFLSVVTMNAQPWKFDGNNCDSSSNTGPYDEWGSPLVTDGVDPITASSDIINFWAVADFTHFYIAFDRVASGNSGFSYYINTDCDTTTGDLTTSGSEFAFFFNVYSGVVSNTTLYEWSGTSYSNTGKTFEALLGHSVCGDHLTDKLFFEMRFPFTDVFDLCDTSGNGCGFITVEAGSTTAGGSPNSATKDRFTVHIPFGVNLPPVASLQNLDTVACLGEEITFDGGSSVDGNFGLGSDDSIVSYEWDLSYDGITFSPSTTGETESVTYLVADTAKLALRVTDMYGCTSVAAHDIYSFKRPSAMINLYYVAWPDPNCRDMRYSSKASLDFAGSNNLTSQWNFGDGGTATLDTGLYVYPDCNDYLVRLVVTDPDNHVDCATDTILSLAFLPVEMGDFSALFNESGQVQLNWETIMEQNNKGWEIFKSKDLVSWSQVGFVEGRRYSNYLNNYSFYDESDVSGINFYRLRQVDFDEKYSFSKIVSVEAGMTVGSDVMIYPNPTKNAVTIRFGESFGEVNGIQVVNQFGEVLKVLAQPGIESILDLSHFASGIYFVQYFEHGKWVSRKVVKY